jgi:hypothetical protein
VTEADKAKHHTYAEALAAGRAATKGQRYEDAIRAFTDAVHMHDDQRAYAERGYAYYLSKQYDLAWKDFDSAIAGPADDALIAQVMYNRGLTALALGRAQDADAAFAWSNRLKPTKAAASHLADKATCPVAVDTKPTSATRYAGWRAWAAAMAAADKEGMVGAGYVADDTEAKAKEHFCKECAGDGPWRVEFGGFEGAWPRVFEVHVLSASGADVWDYGIFGSGWEGPVSGEPCGINDGVDVSTEAKYVVVHARTDPQLRVPMKANDRGDPVGDCPEGSAWGDCLRICMSSEATETFRLLDVTSHTIVMGLTQENHFGKTEQAPPMRVAVHPGAAGFDLQGEGCHPVAYPTRGP